MSISVYSILSSLLSFNLFILLFYFLRKKLGSLLGYHYLPLLLTIVLCVFRLIAPVETPYTTILRSYHVFPWIQTILQAKVIQWGAICLPFGTLIVTICSLVSFFLLFQFWKVICRECKALYTIPKTADARLLPIFQAIKEAAPSNRKCDLLLSQGYKEPFIFSIHRSVIVLPTSMLALSDLDLHFILKHEWQHHLDRDNQVKVAIELLCRILWWNPFIYLLRHNVNQTLELKCDRKIIKYLEAPDKIAYMNSLVRVLRLSFTNVPTTKRQISASISFLGASLPHKEYIDQDIIQRFDCVFSAAKTGKQTAWIVCMVVGLVALFFLSFTFVLQPCSLPPMEDFYSDSYGGTGIQIISVTPQNAYLVDNTDGTHSLYINGEYFRTIEKIEFRNEPYISLPVKTQVHNEE